MNKEKFWTQFPLGAHLCREPMPAMSEMKHDMELLKSKGFNLIKLQENWMIDEPSEGAYDFSRYHELIEHAQKLDMGVYLGLTCEQAPNWLWRKHPDCQMELANGTKVAFQAQSTLHADGKPGPCYDHEGAMADQVMFIKRLVTELGAHENIVVWNTWQEIGYWSEWLAGGTVCYCPNTINAYRRWLCNVYEKDIKNLNTHWNVRYASFDDIIPDRCETMLCVPQNFYFKYFIENVQIANVLKARYNTIKEADPYDRPVFAHKGWPNIGGGTDWIYARTQDFLGTSNYPAWSSGNDWDDHKQAKRPERHSSLQTEMWDNIAFKMNYLRSANKTGAPVWASEFQGGPISTNFHIGRVPDASDIRRWMLTTMGAGATAISFWVARAEIMAPETNGFALLDSESDTTKRFEEAARIGCALQKYPDLFAQNNKPQAQVAILVDEWKSHQMKTMPFAGESLVYDMRGWYKFLWSSNISVDFIEVFQLDEESVINYKTIIVPMPLSMSDMVARGLLNFAKSGGNIILEGGCGRLNEVGFAVRGQINNVLKDALNINVDHFSMVREPDEDDRWSQKERTWGEYEESGFLKGAGILKGLQFKANVIVETYKCSDEKDVCLKWDSRPAGIVKAVGKGKIYLLGTLLGANSTAHIEQASLSSMKKLVSLTGVTIPDCGKLLLQKRIAGNREAWILTNPERETVTQAIAVPKDYCVMDLLDDDVKETDGKVVITVDPLDVCVLILKKIN